MQPNATRYLVVALLGTGAACGGAVSGQLGAGDGGQGDSSARGGGPESGSGSAGSSNGGGSFEAGSSGGSSSGTGSTSGGTSSSGAAEQLDGDSQFEGAHPSGVWDAAIADGTVEDATFDVAAAPSGLAGFAFVVNGVVQTPMKCTGAHWEFPWVTGETVPGSGQYPPLAGITSVVIVNTGMLPMPYLAQSYWNGNAVPGGLTGQSYQLAGVLEPGRQVDITSVYLPGIVALLGSANPFASASAGYAADEGTILWPFGVAGSEGATTMHLAEIEVPYSPMSCAPASKQW